MVIWIIAGILVYTYAAIWIFEKTFWEALKKLAKEGTPIAKEDLQTWRFLLTIWPISIIAIVIFNTIRKGKEKK